MDFKYVKSNVEKISRYDLIKMMVDMILETISKIDNYDENKIYKVLDRVYVNENGKHWVYQCIVNNTSGVFNKTKWVPLFQIYDGPSITFNTLRIREEVYIPTSSVSNYSIKLDFNTEQTSVAIYRGMIRFVKGVDFTINGKDITFNKPLNPNERIIIELRERLGIIPNIIAGIVLYDKDDNPYNVLITKTGVVQIIPIDDKDEIRDLKRVTLLYGENKYNLMVDNSRNKPMLGIFEDVTGYIKSVDGKVYSIIVDDDSSYTLKYEPYEEDGVSYIMGTDKRFYEFNINENIITPVLKNDDSLNPDDHNIGFRMKSTGYKDKMLDVKYGNLRIIDYLPNVAYSNIRLRSKMNGVVYNVTINDDLSLSMNDDGVTDGTYSPIFDELYFYNYDLSNWKLYIDNKNNLTYESCSEVVVRDSRGINIVSENGILAKIVLLPENKIDTIKFIDFSKSGTFKSPLEYGFIVNYDDLKLITLEKNNEKLIATSVPSNLIFKTNEHYILGSDNNIYKITLVNDDVVMSLCNMNDFVVENKRNKIVLKSNNIINIIDVNNNQTEITPITTMIHRIKSDNGNVYLLDVDGERGSEFIKLVLIDENHKYYNEGSGYMYLKDNNNDCYKGKINNDTIQFIKVNDEPLIDYNITNIVNTSKGWYRFNMIDNDIEIEKIFNNIFSDSLCYDISRDFIMESENGEDYSLYINGDCDLSIDKVDNINDKWILLRSSNDKVYSIGVSENSIIIYQSFIEKCAKIEKAYYLKDSVTGKYNILYMNDSELKLEPISTAPNTSTTELYIYDKYEDIYTIISANNELIIVNNIIDKVIDKNGNIYSIILDKGELLFESFNGSSEGLNVGPLKLHDLVTNINYDIYVKNNVMDFENTDSINSSTQAIRIDDIVYILSLFENKISINMINYK